MNAKKQLENKVFSISDQEKISLMKFNQTEDKLRILTKEYDKVREAFLNV